MPDMEIGIEFTDCGSSKPIEVRPKCELRKRIKTMQIQMLNALISPAAIVTL